MSAAEPEEHAERFTLLRPLLFTIAYEILGSATEADDVLQESYLRWTSRPDESAVTNPRRGRAITGLNQGVGGTVSSVGDFFRFVMPSTSGASVTSVRSPHMSETRLGTLRTSSGSSTRGTS